jgi:hypothetical protein
MKSRHHYQRREGKKKEKRRRRRRRKKQGCRNEIWELPPGPLQTVQPYLQLFLQAVSLGNIKLKHIKI